MKRIVERETKQRDVIQFVHSTLADVRKKEQLAAIKQQYEERKAIMQYLVSKKFK